MSEPGSPSCYRFGAFELNPATRSLLKDGATIPLRPRAFDVLLALVDRAGQLLTKGELLDRVWPKTVVEEAALNVQISALRKVLGADAITTVSGRGYQFTWPVTAGERPAAAASKPRHNLPSALTNLIGREQDLAQLDALVPAYRLVTLTGVGGVGKTRLAIEVARRMIEAFPDGVWLVELAALSDSKLVPQAVAQVIAVKEQPTRPVIETLCDYLASRGLLLLLDNAEHLLEGCVHLVDELVRRTRDIAVLVTSRERLAITGERTYLVPSLNAPPPNQALLAAAVSAYASVRLFVERAQLTRPDFEVTNGNASAVASICARLDGLPLAIELAASRLRSMSVEELSQRLDQRFALLRDGSHAALPRHRTLQAVLDWSYELLGEPDRAMLRRSAVFAGGWTLDSAEQVCAGDGIDAADALERLTSLVDKSLVVAEERAGSTRYRMLETVRQYATERLRKDRDEAPWRTRHLAWLGTLAEGFYQGVNGPEAETWFARIAGELDNLRAAIAWARESDPVRGIRLAYHVRAFMMLRGHVSEARKWLTRLLEVLPVDGSVLDRAHALHAAAWLAIPQRDYLVADRQLQESLALYREANDPGGAGRALGSLLHLTVEQGRYPEAEVLAREVCGRAQEAGDRPMLNVGRGYLAIALHGQGRWAAAGELFRQSLEDERSTGSRSVLMSILIEVGRAQCEEDRPDLALKQFVEGMTIAMSLGNRLAIIELLEGIAGVAAAAGAPIRAARLWGAADALRQEDGTLRSIREDMIFDRQVQAVRGTLTPDEFDRAWNQGRAMTLDDAVHLALTEQAHPDT